MNKRFLILIFGAFFLQEQVADIKLPQNFSTIVEKLIFFKKNNFKVFYGGPIGGSDKGVKWVMPVAFEDELHKTTRAVYEIAFVNCNFDTADGAEIMFVDICDIDIKFKNMFSPDYASFASLLRGEYIHEKYIVVRRADVAHIYYPDIFISADHSPHVEDKSQIIHFLHENFKTKNCSKDCNTSLREKQVIAYENDFEISYVPLKVQTNFHGEAHQFFITKKVRKNDIWKLYYIISRDENVLTNSAALSEGLLLRLDSGCVSGQIYNDSACDCLDQLHSALHALTESPSAGIIVHIPAHDGRGFGTAPKAETEIYKIGGKGRLHTTAPLDTVQAAQLLYGCSDFDIRTFDGAAQMCVDANIKKVILLTDNKQKVQALKDAGIEVLRQKTDTVKEACSHHIQAKKNSPYYYNDETNQI